MPRIALIAALSENGVIGADNRLPWRLPADLKHFKQVTMGKPLVMGRKTFDSIGRPLPGRRNIVVSRQREWRAKGVDVCANLDDAIVLAQNAAARDDVDEIMVIGGEQIYRLALPRAQRLYLTRVACQVEGDAYFPDIDGKSWRETFIKSCPAEGDTPACTFWQLDRR